jgi:N-acetyl-alpha-D-muramate 1-phosphate uridylyltransferase
MKLSDAKAIILAAGLGTRLRPLTLTTPKPLVKIAEKPLLDWALSQVSEAGMTEVIVNTSYLYDQVEAHIAQRSAPPLIHVSREMPLPLETGGGIAKALPILGEHPFFVLNSDTICLDGDATPALARLWNAWQQREDLDYLMLLHPCEHAVGFYGAGDFILAEDGRLRKARAGEDAPYVFTGIEIIHPRAFSECPEGAFSLNHLWQKLIGDDGWYHRMAAIIHDGDWLHVGDMQGLNAVETYFQNHPDALLRRR